MAITFQKIADLEYNELLTLYLIENDETLKEIFEEKVKIPFNTLYLLSKDSSETLSQETKDLIYELFDKFVCRRQLLVDKYNYFLSTNLLERKFSNLNETKEPTAIFETKVKENKFPRRYGKEKILKDISEQNSPATPLQRAMIDLNDIRNLYVKLNDRGIKDMFANGTNLTDEDCRKITSAVKTFRQQMESIIKKKNK
jgi:hypothetical protein